MTLENATQAVVQARRLLDLPASEVGVAWRVRLLAAPGAYFLAFVEGQVACIDASSSALMTSAASAHAPVAVAREKALAQAGLGLGASAELVWEPCAATMSMFDPLWLVTRGPESIFVDQRGKRWPTLPAISPG
jgi:hypothetical protein